MMTAVMPRSLYERQLAAHVRWDTLEEVLKIIAPAEGCAEPYRQITKLAAVAIVEIEQLAGVPEDE